MECFVKFLGFIFGGKGEEGFPRSNASSRHGRAADPQTTSSNRTSTVSTTYSVHVQSQPSITQRSSPHPSPPPRPSIAPSCSTPLLSADAPVRHQLPPSAFPSPSFSASSSTAGPHRLEPPVASKTDAVLTAGFYCRVADQQTTSANRISTVNTASSVPAQRQPSITQPPSPHPPPPPPPPSKAPSCSSSSPSTDARVRHQLLPSAFPSPSFSASSSTADPRRLEPPIASKTDAILIDVSDVVLPKKDPSSSSRHGGYSWSVANPQTTSSNRTSTVSTASSVPAQRQPSITQPPSPQPPPPPPSKAPSPSTDARVRHQLLPSAFPSPSFSSASSTADPRRFEPPIASKTDTVFVDVSDVVLPTKDPNSSSRHGGYYWRVANRQTTSSNRTSTVSTASSVPAQRQPSITQPPSPPSPPSKAPSCLSPSPSTDVRAKQQWLPRAFPSSASSSTASPRPLEPPIASKTNAVLVDVSDVVSHKKAPRNSFPYLADFPVQYTQVSPASTPSSPHSSPESGRTTPETPKNRPKRTLTERYEIPEYLEELIKRDSVPAVLQNALSPVNYAEYFGTLLYAEDYEIEKWSDYLLQDVTLSLRAKEEFITPNSNSKQNKKKKKQQNDEKFFVAFEVEEVPERRPYLLSRDFVFLRPAGQKNTEPCKGTIFRMIKSRTVLVEFGRDFHRQHSSSKKYDVSFSFNRVCLKRSHVAVSAAADPLLCKILFPQPDAIATTYSSIQLYPDSVSSSHVIKQILNLKRLVPYLIEGPLVGKKFVGGDFGDLEDDLTVTGHIVREAIVQIYRTSCRCKILVCAPRNWTLDALMKKLMNEIPEGKLFRANAAFRDVDLVPDDILTTCLFEGECFTCPPLGELIEFDVVTSTFMSSFRLHSAGIKADHFTHIFLLDASSSMEPEAVVALANLVSKDTRIIVTGSLQDNPRWVRSGIGRRKNGLRRSFFHRLLQSDPYCSGDPVYVSHVSAE